MQKELGGPSEMIGIYLSVTIASNLVSNILFGRLSFNRGNRSVLVVAAMGGTLMSGLVVLLALLAKPLGISGTAAAYWLIPVFVLSGIRGTGIGVSSNSMLLDITPPGDRSLYIGFTNTILG
jgi:MFS family permease